MDNVREGEVKREKHLPYNPLFVFYDGHLNLDGSLLSSGEGGTYRVLSSLVSATDAAVKEQNLLWHYTNIENFRSIVDSGDIWVSEYLAMNDYSEFEYSLDELELKCFEKLSQRNRLKNVWNFVKDEIRKGFSLYIFSLSLNSNSLHMFREYSRPRGVCIGFPFKLYAEGLNGSWKIGKVFYSKNEHWELMNSFSEKLCKILNNNISKKEKINEISKIKFEFWEIAPFIKGDGFSDEMEIRIITDGTGLKIYERNSPNGPVNFVKLSYLNCLVQYWDVDYAFDNLIASPNKNSNELIKEISRILGERQRKFRIIRESNISAVI